MPQRLELLTGDDLNRQVTLTHFVLTFDSNARRVTFRFDDAEASIPQDDWPLLVDQVGRREPSLWHEPGYPAPLGTALRPIVERLTSTPKYQLFLAGVETAQTLGLLRHNWNLLLRGDVLSNIATPNGRRGRLYFAPADWYRHQDDSVVNELLAHNKICKLIATSDDETQFENVYIPFATPITMVGSLTPSAEQAWRQLKAYSARERVAV